MNLLPSLATGEPTRLVTGLWLTDQARLPETWIVDTWANCAVYILALAHNFVCKIRKSPDFRTELFVEWQSLSNITNSHEQNQPSIFRPLVSQPSSHKNPFCSSFYVSEAVSAAVQILDLVRFLLILSRPKRSRAERLARFQAQGEIARIYTDRIVGNSITNRYDVNWATAVQLLSSAGHALVGWRGRKALLKCLSDIQAKTGWNTRESINGLMAWWGWSKAPSVVGINWKDTAEEIGDESGPGQALLRMFEWNTPKRRS
mgnify:CR=1 FL=1